MPPYTERLLEHFTNPSNVGVLENADGVGLASNPQCGDTTKLYLKIKDGVIADVKWQTYGCGSAIATSSVASEMIKGRPLGEARKLTRAAIAEAVGGLPPAKMHCSVLAADALRAALKDYESRRGRQGSGDAAST